MEEVWVGITGWPWCFRRERNVESSGWVGMDNKGTLEGWNTIVVFGPGRW